jgi:hypothetical protein
MKEISEIEIVYRGRRIAVKEVEQIGGDLDDLYDYNDTLFRDEEGNYYLKQERMCKMPPNAEQAFYERLAEISPALITASGRLPRNHPEMRRLRAFRLRHEKPRVTIKRIKEKTALLWWVHQMSDDEQMKTRLREAVTKTTQ